jgi:photolyase PhrII
MPLDPEIRSFPESIASAILRLPAHLHERIRVVADNRQQAPERKSDSEGLSDGPVVYWTHHAQRVDENPALDVSRMLAHALDRPLLVYQGLSQRYRYASDRHHWFQMQSARSLHRAYSDLGLRYAMHVETVDHEPPSLLELARLASLLVTDDFPGEPTDRWVERLSCVPHLPLLAVDTACVVPMRLVGRAFDRAFAFRDATKRLYAERIDRTWPEVEIQPRKWEGPLPFAEIDFDIVNLEELLARCRIDHGVAPVADTPGGSVEGYHRWNTFLEGPLKNYAAKRNDPMSGVASRMSAYLHYGMVSPMRLAREANARRAEKYLDELLIWRELAYSFCFYRPEYATVKALPTWAVATLQDHESDPRPTTHSWETLSRGRTEDRLWNACQDSLIRQGELHNNVRMTWGKAILSWTRNAEETLELLIDLNHRYALDGRDPASYGGILWCLGQFDRPFTPEQPILGTVRDRSTREHAQRMRVEPFETYVRRPISRRSARIAVIGAGIAGCMCARTLIDHGVDVTLIEKSRGPGGRCATRRIWDQVLVDHGAPYLEFTNHRWDRYVDAWNQDGFIAPWDGTIVQWSESAVSHLPSQRTRWVGTGGMNTLGKHLARDLDCLAHHRVTGVEEFQSGYRLNIERNDAAGNRSAITLGPFDAVVFAMPADQVQTILPTNCSWSNQIPTHSYQPCWTLMAVFDDRWNLPFDGARCSSHGLSWLGRESSKPGRAIDPDTWVIQMDTQWSNRYLEDDPDEVADRIFNHLHDSGLSAYPRVLHSQTHRWRYATTMVPAHHAQSKTAEPFALWDNSNRIGACGDYLGAAGIEGALESGRAMAGRILVWLTRHGAPESRKPGYIQRELF